MEPFEEVPEGAGAAAAARVTSILQAAGDAPGAWEELLPLVYEELRGLAERRMQVERANHTLQATALVHEAYMRLVVDKDMDWQGRRHFYGAAAEAMRRILVDHARRVRRLKRGGDRGRVSISLADMPGDQDAEHVLALNDALDQLAREDERAAEVARLRYFTGLEIEQTAQALNVSERTVKRDWAYARARLTELLRDS